jgi:hypothetical protein
MMLDMLIQIGPSRRHLFFRLSGFAALEHASNALDIALCCATGSGWISPQDPLHAREQH